MLEGHIECLHCSVSWGYHRDQGWSGSHQRSGRRKYSRSSDEMAETVDWSQPTEGDLRDPPVLDPCIQEFLSRTGSHGGDKSDQTLMPKLPFDDPQECVRWCTCQVETPAWWPELQKVPTSNNPMDFTKRVWVSFQLPKVKCLAREKMTIPCHLHPTV